MRLSLISLLLTLSPLDHDLAVDVDDLDGVVVAVADDVGGRGGRAALDPARPVLLAEVAHGLDVLHLADEPKHVVLALAQGGRLEADRLNLEESDEGEI